MEYIVRYYRYQDKNYKWHWPRYYISEYIIDAKPRILETLKITPRPDVIIYAETFYREIIHNYNASKAPHWTFADLFGSSSFLATGTIGVAWIINYALLMRRQMDSNQKTYEDAQKSLCRDG